MSRLHCGGMLLGLAGLAASGQPAPTLHGGVPDGRQEVGEELSTLLTRSRYAKLGYRRLKFLDELEELNSRVTYACNVHEVNPTDWLSQCAYYFKLGGFEGEGQMNPKYSTYYLKDKESGLCTMTLSAAFVNTEYNQSAQEALQDHDLLTTQFADVEAMMPPMALPALMSFPHTALDVVELVKFANKHRMQVSIKNSGHSYSGQSSRKDSIQLNMRRYPVYSKTGVYECESIEPGTLAAAPCKLAMARGKGAVARVGGGEGNDDVLRNLASWNYALPRNSTYQAITGAEGMIGAGGGWFLGGGLGAGQERMWGVGSDQVVWVEMVLPDGRHVKFGPTEWEATEGHMYPQTTKVEGLCNKNVQHRESRWQWGACDDHSINFEDLWFAVRGGGGGTWGVILAVWYQLHDLKSPVYTVNTDFDAVSALQEAVPNQSGWEDVKWSVKNMWTDFLIDFLWKPSALGVPEEISGSCGYTGTATSDSSPWDIFGQFMPTVRWNSMITCYENNAHEVLIEAWKKYVPTSNYKPLGNLTEHIQSLLTSCIMGGGSAGHYMVGLAAGSNFCFNEPLALSPEYASLPKKEKDETVLRQWQTNFMRSPLGQVFDFSGPGTNWPYAWSALLPVSMITEHDRDRIIQLVHKFGSHHILGGKLRAASDGMAVQPRGYREAGLQVMLDSGKLGTADNSTAYLAAIAEISDLVLQYLGVSGQESADGFPGFTEINHQPGRFAGPLKSDWRTPCPLDFTAEQRRTQCMSVQETMWGTSNLRRLEGIKERLDPENLFTVHLGVGNKDVIGAVVM